MSEKKSPRPPATRKKPPALGRGLDALLPTDFTSQPSLPPSNDSAVDGEKLINLPLEQIEPNPYQPRRVFAQEKLQELADNIAQHGILEPLVVRPAQGAYQLISGERRLRASQMLGLETVPVIVRPCTDEQAMLLALVENLQREDLNPMEEARGYKQLAEEFSFSQEEIAKQVSKNRSTIANAIRLLSLPQLLQEDIMEGVLSAGHGRAILALNGEPLMRRARDTVIKQNLNVRATEKMVKAWLNPRKPAAPLTDAAYFDSLQDDLQKNLGTKVEIKRRSKTSGQLILHYLSHEDLEALLNKLR